MEKKRFLVWDTSIGLDHALRLAEDGHVVYYYVSKTEEFAEFQDFIQGDGFPGIKKVHDWGEALLSGVDCVLFTDVGSGAAADYFRKQKIPTYGPSQDGETLEQDRAAAHVLTAELGIKMPPYRLVAGFDGILSFFKSHILKKSGDKKKKGYYVKLPIFRGNVETIYGQSVEDVDIVLRGSNLYSMLGPYSEVFEFVIEDEVTGVEVGIDCFFNGTKFLDMKFFTFEVNSDLTVGKWVTDSIWDDTLEKLTPYLRESGYRGSISLEAMWTGKDLYVLDFTCRFPYIGCAVFTRLIPHYDELIWNVANGNDYDLQVKFPYAGTIGVYSDRAAKDWCLLRISPGAGKVYLRGAVRWKDHYYISPGMKLVAAVTAEDDTWEGVIASLEKRHAKIKVTEGTSIDSTTFVDLVKDYIKPFIDKGGVF